jgi:hypothetical protein
MYGGLDYLAWDENVNSKNVWENPKTTGDIDFHTKFYPSVYLLEIYYFWYCVESVYVQKMTL